METYIFILGRDPELSVDELFSYLESRKMKYDIVEESDIALILNLHTINTGKMIKDLGGTQKIVKVISDFENLYYGKESKIRYAISNYTDEESDNVKYDLKKYFKKEKLKATIKKSHFKQDFLTPTEAQNVLEIVLYKNYVGKTMAVFNPKEFKKRDLERPKQRPLHTISIRLAKILINLSGAKKGDTLLDPFCGIGTVLQEAMLLGIEVYGLDDEFWCVKASKKNLDWLKENYGTRSNYKLIKGKAQAISRYVKKVDFVVTEPFMGPFIKSLPTEREAKKTLKKLQPLYLDFIEQMGKVVRKRAVIVTPRFKTKSRKEFNLNLENAFRKAGFKFDEPFVYTTPTSKILREIWVLSK